MVDNEYEGIVAEISTDATNRLKQNSFANADSNPDEDAKAIATAQEFGTTRQIVKSDPKSFESKKLDTEYSEIISTLPKTSEFLIDTDNHAVAKDDTKSLGFFEKTGATFLERFNENIVDSIIPDGTKNALIRSGFNMESSMIGYIRMLQSAYSPERMGVPEASSLYGGKGSISSSQLKEFQDFLQDEKLAYRDEQAEKSVIKQATDGDWAGAGKSLYLQAVENAPQTIAIMLGGAYGLGLGLATSSGNKFEENLDRGLPEDQARNNAVVTGLFSTGVETLGGFGAKDAFKGSIIAAEKLLGKQSALALAKSVASEMQKNSIQEGGEEFVTEVGQSLYDYATGANPEALNGLAGRSVDALLGGAASGLGFSGVGSIYNYSAASARINKSNKAAVTVETMDQFGKAALESKLQKRSPEKFEQFVTKQAAGTAMETVYISPESMTEYFQSKKVEPAQGAADLGILAEYEKAAQSGSDIAIPLGKYIKNTINTEAYEGLKQDVKFSPGDFTQKQINIQNKAIRQELAEASKRVDQYAQEGTEIKNNIYSQLVDGGMPKERARQSAVIYEAIQTMATREGISPASLYRQYGFEVVGPKSKVNPFALTDGEIDGANTPVTFEDNQGSYNPRTKQIQLFETADETTFLHESGHLFLDVFADLASRPNASDGLKKDFKQTLEFFGVNSKEEIKREQHEKWARYFEAYLMEGKSPSKSMRKAFNSYKLWSLNAYQNLEGLSKAASMDIKMTDEVRGLFSRMLVAEQAIEQASDALDLNLLFKDPIAMGMNQEEAQEYKDAIEDARTYAEAELTNKLLTDLRKKQKSEYREKFNARFNAIKEELSKGQVYGALEILKTSQDFKLDRKSVEDNFGKEVADRLPRGVYGKDGMQYQEASEFFGFDNGSNFITDLAQAAPIDTVAKEQAEQELQTEYPDLFNEPSLDEEAQMALHSEKRSKVLQLELKFLEENHKSLLKDAIYRITGRSSLNKQIRDQAIKIVEAQKVGMIKPYEYSRAETKMSREAAKALAKGDIAKAYEYKRMEYLNHELYRASSAAKMNVEKSIAKYTKLFKPNADMAKYRDMDYVNTARAVLSLYGVTSSRNQSPIDYLRKTALHDAEKFGAIQSLLQDAINGAGTYTEVSYNQFSDMINTVDALWYKSAEEKQIEIENKKMQLNSAISDLDTLFKSHTDGKKDITISGSVSDSQKRAIDFLGFGASLKVVGTWGDFIDKMNPDGAFKKYIWYPVTKAAAKYRVEASSANKAYNDILVRYKDIFQDKKTYIADDLNLVDEEGRNVKFSFKKSDIIMMLLHSGNMSNKSKLLRGGRVYQGKQYAWGSVNELGELDSRNFDRQIAKWRASGVLTKADYQFAQEVWDMFESFKPQLQQAHKKTEGFYFNEVTANEIINEYGTFKGGYIPAKVDVNTDEKADIRQQREQAENNNQSYALPTVSKGATMSRVEAFAAPLTLEFNLLSSHIDWAMKFTHLRPAIRDANKIILNDDFRASLKQIDEVAGSEMLVPWLSRAAEQRSIIPSDKSMKAVDFSARLLRQRFSMQVLALSVTNMMQNFGSTFIANSKVPVKHLMYSSVQLLNHREKTLNFIQESSNFMKSELDGSARMALQQGVDIITQTGTYGKIQDISLQVSGLLDNVTTNFVKTQIWMAEYNHMTEKGMTHDKAVNAADDLTRKTTSVINPEDIARVMSGTQTKALFTQFSGYFNRIANYRYYGLKNIQKELGFGTREGLTTLVPFVIASSILPAIWASFISKALAGKLTEDEEKDGQYWDDLMQSFFGGALFRETVAAVPFVGSIANYAMARANNNPLDDKLSIAPAASAIDTLVSVPFKLAKDYSKQEIKKQTVKDSLTVVGILSGLPVGVLGKPIGYQMDVNDRKARPTGPIDYTRGLVTGQSGKK